MIFTTQHTQHADRNGQECRIVRPLVDGKEIDEAEVGPMFRVAFEDGAEINAFADELEHEDAPSVIWHRL